MRTTGHAGLASMGMRCSCYLQAPTTAMKRLWRFLPGGAMVSGFALAGDVLRPRSGNAQGVTRITAAR